MPNVPLDRLITTASYRLPGVVPGAVQYELFSVLDEFLQDTSAWTDPVSFNAILGQTEYDLAIPAGQILRLAGVVDNNGNAAWATMTTPGHIVLTKPPSVNGTWTATFEVTVSDPLTRDSYPLVPSWIVTRFNRVLLDGALGHMMSQSNKPFSNEQLAVYHLKRFRNGIAMARAEILQGLTRENQAWTFPQSFRVRRKRP